MVGCFGGTGRGAVGITSDCSHSPEGIQSGVLCPRLLTHLLASCPELLAVVATPTLPDLVVLPAQSSISSRTGGRADELVAAIQRPPPPAS